MTEFNPDFQQEADAEILEKLQNLKDFAAQFLDEDFVSFDPKISVQAALALNRLPIKLKEYLKEIAEVESRAVEEKNETDPIKKEEARRKREEKIEKLAQEIFIISCASSKTVDEQKTKEFLEKFNLAKKLNEVGENGLSPVSAMMVSGKDPLEKDKGLAMLLQAGATISAQDLAVAGAKKVEAKEENSRQREREKDGEKIPTRRKLNFKSEQEAVAKAELETEAQQQIIEAGIALEFHQMGMLVLRDQLRAEAAKFNEAQETKNFTEKTAQDVVLQEVEKSKVEISAAPKEQKISQEKISELSKILGIALDEKSINSMLFFAVQNGQSTMAMLLVSFGADVNHVENGKTVLDAAVKSGNNSLISTFLDRASPETKKQALAANLGNDGLVRMIEKSEGLVVGEQKTKDVGKLNSEEFWLKLTEGFKGKNEGFPLPSPSPTGTSQETSVPFLLVGKEASRTQ